MKKLLSLSILVAVMLVGGCVCGPNQITHTTETTGSATEESWLGYLRDGTDQYDSFIGYVRREAHKGNLSLADIGTSEEELEELRVKGCVTDTSSS